jgi:hypothetical protein
MRHGASAAGCAENGAMISILQTNALTGDGTKMMRRIPLSPEAIKEKRKLFANNLDRASTACLTLGLFGPIAAAYFSVPSISVTLLKFVVGATCWGLASLALHIGAQSALDELQWRY